jgi:uncharacterized protein YcfL
MNRSRSLKLMIAAHSLGCVVAGVMLGGCVTRSAGIEGAATAVETPEGIMQSSSFVIINNPKLARGIQIVDLKSSFSGDLLMGQVTLVSKYSNTLKFQYKFAWFNKDGIEIDADSRPWTPLIMYGNESKTIQAVAPNPSAREFKVKIKAN